MSEIPIVEKINIRAKCRFELAVYEDLIFFIGFLSFPNKIVRISSNRKLLNNYNNPTWKFSTNTRVFIPYVEAHVIKMFLIQHTLHSIQGFWIDPLTFRLINRNFIPFGHILIGRSSNGFLHSTQYHARGQSTTRLMHSMWELNAKIAQLMPFYAQHNVRCTVAPLSTIINNITKNKWCILRRHLQFE